MDARKPFLRGKGFGMIDCSEYRPSDRMRSLHERNERRNPVCVEYIMVLVRISPSILAYFLLCSALRGEPPTDQPSVPLPPGESELKALWANLAGNDAAKAYRAIWSLAAAPQQAVPFLRKHLKPAVAPDAQKLKQLLADLDSPRFTVREKAAQELAKLGDFAEPGLRRVLEAKPSLEVRQRVERLLEQQQGPVVSPERLREIRAVEALEHMDSAEARRLLRELAAGAEGARLTREAKAAEARLSARSAAPK
jgi:hypothetical protein